ncbi:hypothetical protein VPH35_002307 [Triticum aestivum]|uniref:Uncharacterized protein n=1 Tax=Triticum urartu TaxID=4572 RepID=A0A8R7NZG9_TRIUA
MQQRRGRPSGTDGSDFSYRMVVDSRYQRVADGRSRLARLMLVQTLHQVAGGALLLLSLSKGTEINKFAVLSLAAGLLAILLGEFGDESIITVFSLCLQISLSFAQNIRSESGFSDKIAMRSYKAFTSFS